MPKPPLDLVLNLHCHQPVGNFGWVIDEATAKCYRPLLETLGRFPQIRAVLHFSGPLVEWWQGHAPELLDLVRQGVGAGRYEVQASGLDEPILPVLPRRDRLDQIALHRRLMRECFGADSDGLWLTERVWEPSLPADLVEAGIQSLALDDHHFATAGAAEGDGYVVTESEGAVVRVFPISQELRYLIPFEPVPRVMEFLRESHEQGKTLLVYGDDGEKFGVWPETFDWVVEGKWLESFLEAVTDASAWLRTVTYQDVTRQRTPIAKTYFPTASYEEMEGWCLPVDVQRERDQTWEQLTPEHQESLAPFFRGTLWRGMLARYPESNRMYQRMLRVSAATQEAGLRERPLAANQELPAAVRSLFRAQCNCAYWHGVFGGLYLPFLRDAVVEHLLAARTQLPERDSRSQLQDLDADGHQEILLEKDGWSVWISPERGGVLEVLDHLPSCKSLSNVLTRRAEAYHEEWIEQAAEERKPESPAGSPATDSLKGEPEDTTACEEAEVASEGTDEDAPRSIHARPLALDATAEEIRTYDRWPRCVGALHLAPASSDPATLAKNQGIGEFMVPATRYTVEEPTAGKWRLQATVNCDGALEVERHYRIEKGALVCTTQLRQNTSDTRPLLAAIRLDLSVPRFGDPSRCIRQEDGTRVLPQEPVTFPGTRVVLEDPPFEFEWRSSLPFQAILEPVYTFSRSEVGVERTHQGISLLLATWVLLKRNEPFPWDLTLRASDKVPSRGDD